MLQALLRQGLHHEAMLASASPLELQTGSQIGLIFF